MKKATIVIGILTANALFAVALAAVIYWSGTMVLRQTINPPVSASMSTTMIVALPEIYSGDTSVYTETQIPKFDACLTVDVYVSTKRVTLELSNEASLTPYYEFFRIDFIAQSFPAGTGWASGEILRSIGFGYSGADNLQTVLLQEEGKYVFDMQLTVTTRSNVTESVTAQPRILFQILD